MLFHCLHGAWHGGWVWRAVAGELESRGHRVCAPDLPGLGDDAAHLHRSIDLQSHINAATPSQPSCLVAHSWAGVLARAIVDREPTRVTGIVLIEALWPQHGQCAFDHIPAAARAKLQRSIAERGDGWRLPPPDASQFNLDDPDLQRRVQRKLTDHPARTFSDPVSLCNASPLGSYVIATDRDPQPYHATAARLESDGWKIHRMAGGHSPMLTRPAAIAQLLASATTGVTTDAT